MSGIKEKIKYFVAEEKDSPNSSSGLISYLSKGLTPKFLFAIERIVAKRGSDITFGKDCSAPLSDEFVDLLTGLFQAS